MKRTKISFVGEKPIFTGSPQIVPGGFNLDREKQRFSVGDIIPAGTLAIFDEVTRKVLQLEIEREALKKEKDKASQDRLESLEKDRISIGMGIKESLIEIQQELFLTFKNSV